MKNIFVVVFFAISIGIGSSSALPTTTTTTTTKETTTAKPCRASKGSAGFIPGISVNLYKNIYKSAALVGSCDLDNPLGWTEYYNGTNPVIPNVKASRAIGTWRQKYCDYPCICSNESCYEPRLNGDLILYPYCSSKTGCFVAVLMNNFVELVNPNNSSDILFSLDQINLDTFVRKPVTDSSYLKVKYVGCYECLNMTTTTG